MTTIDPIRKRAALKAKLTIFNSFLIQFETKVNDKTVSDVDYKQLQIKSRDFNRNILSNFEEIQIEIENASDDAQVDLQERLAFDNQYYSLLAKAEQHLDNVYKNNAQNNASSSSESNDFKFRLPPIDIPKFDGNFQLWLEYRDTFESMIHKNTVLSNIQKFHYLRGSLTGPAALVIKSLEFSANNYDVAWKSLLDRYNNSRILIQNHIKTLFNIEPIFKESPEGIRSLIDSVSKHMRCLEQLNEPTVDTLIIYLINTKLDTNSSRDWEEYKNSQVPDDNAPTLDDMKKFLKNKADLLETLKINKVKIQTEHKRVSNNTKGFFTASQNCNICKESHKIFACNEFLQLNVHDRIKKVQELKLCINCLKFGHHSKVCKGKSCKYCSLKHNSLLHINRQQNYNNETQGTVQTKDEGAETQVSVSSGSTPIQSTNFHVSTDQFSAASTSHGNQINHSTSNANLYNPNEVLLSTARVRVLDKNNKPHILRVLLDSGSQSSFIRNDIAEKLMLDKQTINMSVSGLNRAKSQIQYKCNVQLGSLYNAFSTNISCLVLPNITGHLPNLRLNIQELKIPAHIKLADSSYNEPSQIDMLIGAEIFWSLICVGQIFLGKQKPVLQKTKLGWVVSGYFGQNSDKNINNNIHCNFSQNENEIQDQLKRFWEVEEGFLNKKIYSPEELECEKHFQENTHRLSDGRFVVKIPFKDSPGTLGDSFQQAQKQFLSLERKLELKPELKLQYVEFMKEYEVLGHMVKVIGQKQLAHAYYMPHHGVVREDSLTTKLRVVFNGSMKTSNGLSFNDIQMTGPTIQNDLVSILLRFRQHMYVVAADITKMYRQILVESEQRSLQRILWRESSDKPLETYELQTVTYGTRSAPFLAIRCLFQLALEHEKINSKITEVIKNDFYVDDILTGADTVDEAAQITRDVSEVLRTGQFILRKFYSNDDRILQYVEKSGTSDNDIVIFSENENAKPLGLIWDCHSDNLMYRINEYSKHLPVTKRTILAVTAQIFDPLGLLAVCIIKPKILLQRLWLEKLSWDEAVPLQLYTSWTEFRDQLPVLNNLRTFRHVICQNPISIQLHGFCDSSEQAYGGCIYVRSIDNDGEVHVRLFCAKAKVAPLKSITLPRLELCGALVLTRLLKKIISSTTIKFNKCVLWTDSTVVLGWLKTPPNLLKAFVNTRVAEIQSLTENCEWRHVPSKQNPADLLSRGLSPLEVLESTMWFQGPDWLKDDQWRWPFKEAKIENLPEVRKIGTQAFSIAVRQNVSEFFERFSSFLRIKRVTAYIFRFIKNCRQKDKSNITVGSLTVQEISLAQRVLIKMSQEQSFPFDMSSLNSKGIISKKSKLLSLSPFLDENLILRVGGRLANSTFEYTKKHPILLDSNHKFTQLLFDHEHTRLLHAGPQHLLASIRDEFWPLRGRQLARKTFRKCVICFKNKPKILQPIMGNLPRERLEPGVPFIVTGVDYAGPYSIKDRKTRGAKMSKCWIALFVCFATRAVHLELVTDFTV